MRAGLEGRDRKRRSSVRESGGAQIRVSFEQRNTALGIHGRVLQKDLDRKWRPIGGLWSSSQRERRLLHRNRDGNIVDRVRTETIRYRHEVSPQCMDSGGRT